MHFQAEKVLQMYFEEQTEASPDRIAVFCAQECHSITYRELNERADRLAHRLQDMGVKPDTIVALMVDPSIECILSIMTILKAGGAYLPINPEYPQDRIDYMLRDSNAKILINKSEARSTKSETNPNVQNTNDQNKNRGLRATFVLNFEHLNFEFVSSFEFRISDLIPSNLAYVIYTSGSTGAPKGVAVEHRNVVNLVLGLNERVYSKYSEGLRIALAAPCIFDGSVKQIFGALLNGHTLCIVPEETRGDGVRLAEFYNKYCIDISDGAPAHIRLLTGVTPPPKLMHFLIGGEALSVSVVERFFSGYGHCKSPLITNVYGPTECCVDTTAFEVSQESIHKLKGFDVVPIGTPLLNQEVSISDDTGELCIAGASVSRGYLNNPELTRGSFEKPPLDPAKLLFNYHLPLTTHHSPLYHTGDLARFLPDGSIEFLGRIDHQVKIRGYRIELGEIEARLATHPLVKEVVVTAREDHFGDKYLCAYVVPAAAAAAIQTELKQYLSLTLPGYMIPLFFVILDKMPLTDSGKVDRQSLPAPIQAARPSYAAPANIMEKTLVEIWSEVMGIPAEIIGVADHFLDWGGHSLKAAAISARIFDKFHLQLSLADIFKYPDIRQMAQFLAHSPAKNYPTIRAAEEKPFYRLSSAQERIYIASQMSPDTTLYNITLVFQIAETAALNPGRLRNAFKQLIARHESFRTSFHPVDDQPRQKIHKKVEFKVKEEKGFHHSSFIIHHFIKPFDLSRAPLLRVHLFKTGEGRRLLLIDMHHIISDGLSVEILQRELEALSMGRTIPPLPLCYKDYAEWEHSEEWQERIKKQEQYWLKEFRDEITPLHLSLDYPRPLVPTYKGDAEEFHLDETEITSWNNLAKEYHMTPFMLALAVYAIFLSKLSDRETVIVGTVHDGRENSQLRSIIGMFVNTTAIRCFPIGSKPLHVFLEETRAIVTDVFENRDYPFDRLVEKLALPRDPSHHPLFDVMLAFREKNEMEIKGDRQETATGGLKLERLKFHEKTAKYDLVLSVEENEGKLDFTLNYSTGLFKAETIRCFAAYLKTITAKVLQKSKTTLISEIDPLPMEERNRLLYQFNDTARDYPRDKTIHWLFAEQSEKTPDSIALVGADPRVCPVRLTYRQLNDQSGRLAMILLEKGVLADDIVAIMIERSIEMIIAILGVLKSGGAYLPIDPQYPKDRIDYMLRDCNLKILINKSEARISKSETNPNVQNTNDQNKNRGLRATFVLNFEHLNFEFVSSFEFRISDLIPSNLAYVIYTSGSTGRPKGVMVEHRGLVNLCVWHNWYYSITSRDRGTLSADPGFDAFVWELFPYLVCGAAVHILSEDLRLDGVRLNKYYEKYQVTVAFLSTAAYEQFGPELAANRSLRLLLIGGDKLRRVCLAVSPAGRFRVYNNYGPTENTVVTTAYPVDEEEDDIPIGKPISNTRLYILRKDTLHLQPIGAAGELCIAGVGVARGYLNNPELTTEKFIKSFAGVKGGLFQKPPLVAFKTGDLVRWLSDGNIQFLGRIDQQVKIRGFRIELGEIEKRLTGYPSVRDAVVMAREDESGEKKLCAYVTPRETGTINVQHIKEYLTHYLPHYMVPRYYVEIKQIPLTSSGKIDRRALPGPLVSTGGVYAAPRNPTEEALVEIWRDLLFAKETQTPLPGIDDNFFEIGGHSLKATILAGRIEKNFHIKCPLTYIFQYPTIRELAGRIRETAVIGEEQIPPVEEKEYYPLSSAQKRLFFLDRWENIGTSYHITFAFSVKGKLDIERLEKVSQLLIERHECLRTSFHLVGDEPVQRIHESNVFLGVQGAIFSKKAPWSFIQPFDLSCAPLFRVGVSSVSAEEVLLIFDMHHIIGDGTSMGVFFQEFSRLYNSGDPGLEVGRLPMPGIHYRDFSQWQNRLMESDKINEQENYWLNLYPDVADLPRLELPYDFPRPGRLSFAGDHCRFSLSSAETCRFRQLIRAKSVTPYMGLLAAFIVLLYKYTGQYDMVVGAGVMGRRFAGLENIIGMFVNTLAIRYFPHGEITYDEFLTQVKEWNIKAFENQDVQFEALVERLNLPRDPGHNPLFDVLFVLQNFQPGELSLEGAVLTPYPLEKKNSKFDLTLFAQEKGEVIHFSLEYCTALFKSETMERMAGHFVRVLNQVCATPGITLDTIELLSLEEKRQLVEDFNSTSAEYPREKTIQQLFAEQVEKTPDLIACVGADSQICPITLSYNELHEQSNQLANYLYSEIVMTPGECVAILLDRSIDRVMAMLGVLKSGSAYIPLESSLPEARIKTIIDDGVVRTIISQKKYIRLLNRLQWECCSLQTFLCLDSEDIHAELEVEQSALMDTKLWEYVGETATDEITGGGWISSYTGEPFPPAEMAEYGDNVLHKLEPLLHKKMQVLEIGCATGITMFRIAPRVDIYYGTDLSPVIIEKIKHRVKEEGYKNIRLQCMAAHEIDWLEEGNFDLVIINSVIQCFHGHNYLRQVLRKVAAKIGPSGYLFIGDIMDQQLKHSLIREMQEFKKNRGSHANPRTKTDWSAELFISRDFFEDLQWDIPEIGKIEFSRKIYTIENELTKFRYDALLSIDKKIGKRRRGFYARHKYQDDMRALREYGNKMPVVKSGDGAGSPAYVIYTSGTTGRPRGVIVEHRALVNLCWWHHNYYDIKERDRAVQYASFSFDASVWEVFPYLVKGVVLIVIPNEMPPDVEELNNFFEKHQVTIAFLPTLLCEQFMAIDNYSLRVLLTGGDKLHHFIKRNYRLYNNYGPTENAVVATAYRVEESSANISIGAPIANNQIYILSKDSFQLQPLGVPGELCIAGDSLARGYLNNPELSAEKFIKSFAGVKGGLFQKPPLVAFKTGDLARWLAGGNIEFLGRIDQQVKIRGFRIELEEIRRRLEMHEAVQEAVVIVREEGGGEKKICAYIVLRNNLGDDFSAEITAKLSEFLAITLPEYMIPAHFVLLEKIPVNSSGKIDRKALPSPASLAIAVGQYTAPRDTLEKILAEIWTTVLNPGNDKTAVGIDTDFFKAGGHSLNVAALVSRIHRELQVRVPLSQVFSSPAIRGLAEYIRGADRERWLGIEPAPVRPNYPLSPAQRRVYILDRMGAVYNMPRVLTVTGNLDVQKLESALKQMIRRHESLRTSFHMMADQPVQEIHDNVEFNIESYDSSTDYTDYTDDKDDKIHHSSFIIHHFIRAFDLSKAPLLRVRVIKEAEEQYVLMIDTHHIVSDGISQGIFMKELWALYAGKSLPLPRLQYKDYAWQQRRQQKDMEMFWLNQFQGETPLLDLPYDFPRPPAQDYRGKTIPFEFSPIETQAFKSICFPVRTGVAVTLYMAALALFNVLLAKLSGAEDIVIGTPIAGRSRPDLQAIIGMFVGTLAMRHFPAAEKKFNIFLEEIRKQTLAAFENQEYPFEELVEKVGIARDAGRSPLFDAMLAVQNIDRPGIEIPGLIVKPRSFDYSPANFDLFLQCYESGDIIKWSLNYSISLFEETTIRRFILYFKEIIKSVSENPRQRIADIDMLPDEEKKQLLYDFNNTAVDYPKEKTIQQLFEEQVEKSPDRIAVIGGHGRTRTNTDKIFVSYDHLNEQSDRLACLLIEKGVLADNIVAIMIERSIEMIIAILGVLKSGGAYLPIDPEYPKERIDYMLRDSHSRVLVIARDLNEKEIIINCPLLIANCKLLIGRPSHGHHHSSFIIHHSNHLAYVIYTSGSTGQPKGVMIENRSVVNFITGISRVIPFTSADSILSLTTISFDIFVLETLLPLTAGSMVVIGTPDQQTDPVAFAAVMERENITHLQLTPSRLQLFMDYGESVRCLERLRYLLVGGELFPDYLLQKVQTFIKGKLYNLYGPTETTVWSMCRCVEKGDRGINIGMPLANTQVYILASGGGIQPVGVPGELCIGGVGIARGYLNNPELTFQKFNRSYRSYKTYIFYKSGDLARWFSDGSIEFLGRIDQQVKIRGFRIELGEIEALLLKHNAIEEAVVVLSGRSGNQQLCAYVKARQEVPVPELMDHLARWLPAYMIPNHFVFLERVPLTPSGKIDRKALPSPELGAGNGEYNAPRDKVEKNLLNIWSEILETDRKCIGIDSNFFQLGGHSLRVINMTMKIHREFSVKIAMTEVFRNPTIRGLARLIRGAAGNRLHTIPPAETREYYDLSSSQKRLYIVYRLDPQSTVYNMTTRVILEGRMDWERIENTFRELIRRHESLRTSFQIIAGNPVQRIHENALFEIEYYNISAQAPEGNSLEAKEYEEEKNRYTSVIIHHFIRPFDLSRVPLLRVGLLKMEEYQHILMVDMPHIIADGLAHRLLVEEFMALYRGEALHPLQMQYKDFSQWQNSPAMQEEMQKHETFWLSRFAGDIPVLQIPVDYPRTGIHSPEGSTMTFELAAANAQKLRELAAEEGATLYMVILAVFNVLLYKLSGQEDVVVGTAVAGRNHPDLERVIGIFLNTLALRNFPRGQQTFKQFLTEVKEKTLAAFDHQDYQFEELVHKVMKVREKDRRPLFDVMFGFTPYTPVSAAQKSPIKKNPDALQFIPYKRKGVQARFDITFTGADNGETFVFLFEYSTALFKPRTMERFAGYFKDIAAAVTALPQVLLKDIVISTKLTPAVSDAFQDDENDFKF